MEQLIENLKTFVSERNWGQYHSPKNLAIGISIEANELLEIFMWLNENESKSLSEAQMDKIREEVGDITINLLNFCHNLSINPIDCANMKLESIKMKYPVERSYGSAKKYDEL
jgi:dCTP diphosphatase